MVLLIIDVQLDFCLGGSLAVPEADLIIPGINNIREKFQNVILTQDWHPSNHVSFGSTHNLPPYTKIELSDHSI
jgi:nicotinamidase/pyrazinamidase